MKVCFPIAKDEGMNSTVYDHFGSAPAFLAVDTETGAARVITNNNQHHAHGMCSPIQALAGEHPDAVVVGGIGGGALIKLNAAGIRVFCAGSYSIADNLVALKNGTLAEFTLETSCAHHGRDRH